MNKFMEMLLQTFTGLDGKTIDIGRVLWAQSVFVFFGIFVQVGVGKVLKGEQLHGHLQALAEVFFLEVVVGILIPGPVGIYRT